MGHGMAHLAILICLLPVDRGRWAAAARGSSISELVSLHVYMWMAKSLSTVRKISLKVVEWCLVDHAIYSR